jgi:hypothetical protein
MRYCELYAMKKGERQSGSVCLFPLTLSTALDIHKIIIFQLATQPRSNASPGSTAGKFPAGHLHKYFGAHIQSF